MRITNVDGITLDDAMLPDEPFVTLAELRSRARLCEEIQDEDLGLRRLLEHPEDLAPRFLHTMH